MSYTIQPNSASNRSFGRENSQLIARLILNLRGNNSAVISEAAYCLGELGNTARAALPELRNLINHSDPEVIANTREAIAKINGRHPVISIS